jgi:hypothetical protein
MPNRESIPYANIKVNETENLVSNAEGYFTLSENNSRDETVLSVLIWDLLIDN